MSLRAFDCRPEAEEKFNRWINEIHIPMILKSGQVRTVTRCQRVGNDAAYPKYVTIFEFEDQQAYEEYDASPETAGMREELKHLWQPGTFESKWRVQYEVIREPWKK